MKLLDSNNKPLTLADAAKLPADTSYYAMAVAMAHIASAAVCVARMRRLGLPIDSALTVMCEIVAENREAAGFESDADVGGKS